VRRAKAVAHRGAGSTARTSISFPVAASQIRAVSSCDVCSVFELYPDNREEVVQDDLSPIEAEILCAAKMADIPRAAQQVDAPVKTVSAGAKIPH
jgi:hypothetical protein